MRRAGATAAVLMAVAVVAGCGQQSAETAPERMRSGGFVQVHGSRTTGSLGDRRLAAYAVFYEDVQVGPGDYDPAYPLFSLDPLDTCHPFSQSGETAPEITFKDVGESFRIEANGAAFEMRRREVGGELVYDHAADPIPVTTSPIVFDIVFGDGVRWEDALHVPAEPVIQPPFGRSWAIQDATDHVLRWTPAGADRLFIAFYWNARLRTFCVAEDDGEFTIPADVVSSLRTTGSYLVRAERVHHYAVEERVVRLEGHSGLRGYFTKDP